MSRFIWTLSLVLFLGACGGGGDGGSRLPTVDPDPTQSLTGLQAPSFTDSEIPSLLNRALGSADSVLATDVYVGRGEDGVVLATDCYRKEVCLILFPDGTASSFDIREGLGELVNSGRLSGVGEKFGVSLAQHQGPSEIFGFTTNITEYGAWLEHSGFVVTLERVTRGTLYGQDLSGVTIGYALSIGDNTGSRPTGSATWRGVMVGGTGDIISPDVIQGDATLTYDVGRNDLDVAFTNVYNLDERTRFTDMQWSDVRVASNGDFNQQSATGSILGRFYGPGHVEVGGTFEHIEAIGAFGAKR